MKIVIYENKHSEPSDMYAQQYGRAAAVAHILLHCMGTQLIHNKNTIFHNKLITSLTYLLTLIFFSYTKLSPTLKLFRVYNTAEW